MNKQDSETPVSILFLTVRRDHFPRPNLGLCFMDLSSSIKDLACPSQPSLSYAHSPFGCKYLSKSRGIDNIAVPIFRVLFSSTYCFQEVKPTFFAVLCSGTDSHYVAQTGLELTWRRNLFPELMILSALDP